MPICDNPHTTAWHRTYNPRKNRESGSDRHHCCHYFLAYQGGMENTDHGVFCWPKSTRRRKHSWRTRNMEPQASLIAQREINNFLHEPFHRSCQRGNGRKKNHKCIVSVTNSRSEGQWRGTLRIHVESSSKYQQRRPLSTRRTAPPQTVMSPGTEQESSHYAKVHIIELHLSHRFDSQYDPETTRRPCGGTDAHSVRIKAKTGAPLGYREIVLHRQWQCLRDRTEEDLRKAPRRCPAGLTGREGRWQAAEP